MFLADAPEAETDGIRGYRPANPDNAGRQFKIISA